MSDPSFTTAFTVDRGVRFTHVGVAPESECFDACSNAWRYYVDTSLRNRIVTGRTER